MENKSISMKLSKFLKKMNYLNINHIPMLSDEIITELTYICHTSNCILFRILYFKENSFIASDIVGISLPENYINFHYNSSGKSKAEKSILKIKRKMQELGADSYYMVHCYYHLALNIQKNIDITMFFYKNLKGFQGHLLINSQNYIWLNIKKNNVTISKQKTIKKFCLCSLLTSEKKYVINLMKKFQNTQNYSNIIITNQERMPQMILDIPYFFKIPLLKELIINNLNDYQKILVTNNENIFTSYLSLNITESEILYKELNGKLYIIRKRGK